MIRGMTGTILWVCLAGVVGVGLFFVKHEVSDLETRLAGVTHDIQSNEEEVHVLQAEWSYLNDPARLRELAEKHLGMRPIAPTQIATLDTLPGDSAVSAFASAEARGGAAADVPAHRHTEKARSASARVAVVVPPSRGRKVALAAVPTLTATEFVSGREEAR